jgi:hypothetical protein
MGIKSRRIGWAARVARTAEMENTILMGKPEGKDQLGDVGVVGRIILKISLKK